MKQKKSRVGENRGKGIVVQKKYTANFTRILVKGPRVRQNMDLSERGPLKKVHTGEANADPKRGRDTGSQTTISQRNILSTTPHQT